MKAVRKKRSGDLNKTSSIRGRCKLEFSWKKGEGKQWLLRKEGVAHAVYEIIDSA